MHVLFPLYGDAGSSRGQEAWGAVTNYAYASILFQMPDENCAIFGHFPYAFRTFFWNSCGKIDEFK